MNYHKQQILFITSLLFLSNIAFAKPKYKLVWGLNEQLDYYKEVAEKFKKEIALESNGEIEIEIKYFPHDPDNPIADIKNNKYHLYQMNVETIHEFYREEAPELSLYGVPFLFKDKGHVEKYLTSQKAHNVLAKVENESLLPLTYSYAGGFVAAITNSPLTNPKFSEFKDLPLCSVSSQPYKVEEETIKYAESFPKEMPCYVLLYELNEFASFSQYLKNPINISLVNHDVITRASYISKKFLKTIPKKYQDLLTKKLTLTLKQERQYIYARGERNINQLKTLPNINIHYFSENQRNNLRDQAVKRLITTKEAKEEINYIKGLLKETPQKSKISSFESLQKSKNDPPKLSSHIQK